MSDTFLSLTNVELRQALESRIQCCTKLQMTNDRLRAALKEIAEPLYQCSNCCADYARKALAEQEER
jgi:hypothetical protein